MNNIVTIVEITSVLLAIIAVPLSTIKYPYDSHKPQNYADNHGIPDDIEFKNSFNLLSQVYPESKKDNVR